MSQPSSKKWVDYSDSSDDEEIPPKQVEKATPLIQQIKKPIQIKSLKPNQETINQQLNLLDQLDRDRIAEVWMLLTSTDQHYLHQEIQYLKKKITNKSQVIKIYRSKVSEDSWDVLVLIDLAYDWINQGFDSTHLITVQVAGRNFNTSKAQKQENTNFEKKKVVYVDKETGKSNLQKIQQQPKKIFTEKEFQHKGKEIGNFKQKKYQPKEEIKKQVIIQQGIQTKETVIQKVKASEEKKEKKKTEKKVAVKKKIKSGNIFQQFAEDSN